LFDGAKLSSMLGNLADDRFVRGDVYYIQQGWDADRIPQWRRQPAMIVNLNQYRKKRRRAEA